ncbi:MAG: hypothetical protein LUD72_10660 [Bacteroidales bacterium]|nr:hypothetical protein [Bacteroidales bacterium]
MKKLAIILTITATAVAAQSCQWLRGIIHDDEVVAKVGREVLYRSEVEALIPEGLSEGDSLRLSMQYINNWATDIVFTNIAEEKLSRTEKDVSKEQEYYRRSLLKYRYEQKYISERLDTTVTEREINDYYAAHADTYVLKAPVVKARYLRILPGSPDLAKLRRVMSSDEEDALWQTETLAASTSDIFKGYDDNWIDVAVLARDMGMDEIKDIARMRDRFVENLDGNGMLNLAYIVDITLEGEPAPVEYCAPSITDIILSTRKRMLASSLEQELLTSARNKGKFVIY